MEYPSFIQYYPSHGCNQNCVFCFNKNIPTGQPREMGESRALLLADLAAGHGVREIDILGGEPLLVPWIKKFVVYALDSGLVVNLSTNGSLPDAVVDLAKAAPATLNIGVSVLGLSETHNRLTRSENFSRAIAGIKKLVSCGRNPIAKSVLTHENREEIFRLASCLAGLGVREYFLLHEDIIGRTDQMALSFPEYYSLYEELKTAMANRLATGFVAASGFYKYTHGAAARCDAGVAKIAVMPDGSAFPCNLFAGFPEFFLGNIFGDGIDKIMRHPVLRHFRQRRAGNPCADRGCPHFHRCSGGCPAHSYSYYGSLDAVDPRCRIRSDAADSAGGPE